MTPLRLGAILRRRTLLTEEDLAFVLAVQRARGGLVPSGRLLVEHNIVPEVQVAAALAEQVGWRLHDGPLLPDQESVDVMGAAFFREHRVYPQRSLDGKAFVMTDGYDTKVTDALQEKFNGRATFFLGADSAVEHALEVLERRDHAREVLQVEDDRPVDAAILLKEAVYRSATDIHVEPGLGVAHVRLRIDGVLHHHRTLPGVELSRLVNMFFSRAGISAGDHLRLHDARFSEVVGGRTLDVRLSHIPSASGPSVVLRLLDRSRAAMPLQALGYEPSRLALIHQALRKPHGMVLFAGPTGCGKTTSLYSLLNTIKGIGVKVVTAEDPVEVRVPLVTQVGVDERREHDFHHITRALLRHDPDVILIGEIRDEKTAREAVRAAVTGHRVFATLHTNDALSALLRLKDLGVDREQLAGVLNAVVAQRLVRCLCLQCREEDAGVFVARGCPSCLGGFKGQAVAAEVLLLGPRAAELLGTGKFQDIAALGIVGDAWTMKADAERLVRQGITSRPEMERVFG